METRGGGKMGSSESDWSGMGQAQLGRDGESGGRGRGRLLAWASKEDRVAYRQGSHLHFDVTPARPCAPGRTTPPQTTPVRARRPNPPIADQQSGRREALTGRRREPGKGRRAADTIRSGHQAEADSRPVSGGGGGDGGARVRAGRSERFGRVGRPLRVRPGVALGVRSVRGG